MSYPKEQKQLPDLEVTQALLVEAIDKIDEGMALFDSEKQFLVANGQFTQIFGQYQYLLEPGKALQEIINQAIRNGQITPAKESVAAFQTLTSDIESDPILQLDVIVADMGTKSITCRLLNAGGILMTVTSTSDNDQDKTQVFARKLLIDAIDTVDFGIALVDDDERLVFANRKCREIADPNNHMLIVGRKMRDNHEYAIDNGLFPLAKGMTRESLLDELDGTLKNSSKGFRLPNTLNRKIIGSVYQTPIGGRLLTVEDVTDRVRAEEELIQQREISQQNEKLSALGVLLAGVAHELNNPLSIIVGYAEILERELDDPLLRMRAERIHQAANRSAKIVRTFLSMARQESANKRPSSLNEIISIAADVAGYRSRKNGTSLELDLANDLPAIAGDVDQLVQVFSNLIVNAEQATAALRGDGNILLRTSYDASKGVVVAEVRDNGSGIQAEIQNRIFEPFFTTKDIGEGTGVGLAFCHRIVDAHGGKIEVKSSVGVGSSFFISLSGIHEELILSEPSSYSAPIQEKRSCLIVDDEIWVAELIRDLLSQQITNMEVCTSVEEALNKLQTKEFDLVLSDFKMPGLDGKDFFEILKREKPEYINRIGFITGDTMSKDVVAFFSEVDRPYIQKPISTNELYGLVAKVSQLD